MGWSLNFEMLDKPIRVFGMTSFVIQSRTVFAKLIQNLYQYTEETKELKLFDDDYKQLKKDELLVLTDMLGYDINSVSVLKLLYKDLEQQISLEPEIKMEIEDAINMAMNLINKEFLHFELDLESDKVEINSFFKAMNMRIHVESSTIFERALDILRVFKYLAKKKLLVFVNLSTYLSRSEVEALAEQVELLNISVLMLDNAPFEAKINQIIMDEDYVLLPNIMV
ncbi:MAG: type II-A CRISPR-associated protein Csn2 [Lachnospiraceae bacterium]|nr:type II-A CRISPR-associated protein Csn2 [Lachnospiraceae bacterium]